MKTYIVSEEVLRQMLDGVLENETIAVVETLRAILSKEPNEPVAYLAANGTHAELAAVVGDCFPNWTDYYTTPLYRKDA